MDSAFADDVTYESSDDNALVTTSDDADTGVTETEEKQ
jgi:hypothetical protein